MKGHLITEVYRGYVGQAEYDADADFFHGELLGNRDVITFVASKPSQLQRAFEESVDDYLDWCRERGKQPHKPFSGTILIRATPDLHRALHTRALSEGKSVNALVVEQLESLAAQPLRKTRRKAV